MQGRHCLRYWRENMGINDMDEINARIIELLKDNARLSYSEIGDQVGISRVAVKKRIDKLEKSGVIKGYRVVLGTDEYYNKRLFFIDVETKPDQFENVARVMADYDIVRKLYVINGDYRLRAELYASEREYKYFVEDFKRRLDGVEGIVANFALYTIKYIDGGVDYERKEESAL